MNSELFLPFTFLNRMIFSFLSVAEKGTKRKLVKYKVPGGKKVTLIDKEAVLAFDDYYPEWDKKLYIVPSQPRKKNTLFGSDRGYEGEAEVERALMGSKIKGILISSFSNKDQNNILQSNSELKFELDFILLTKDNGLWSVEVCSSKEKRIQDSIEEKSEQIIRNHNHILKLAEELYGEAFSLELAKICNGIVAVPNAIFDDFEKFKKTPLWEDFISSNPSFKIEFIGKEQVSEPSTTAEFICKRQLCISQTSSEYLRKFYSTITLVKTSYKTLDLDENLSKKEKMDISKVSYGMDINKYHVILSPEQQSILLDLPTHLQIIGEAATGKTELLKAVAHIIFKYNSDRSKCLQPNVSSIAEGVNSILYFVLGDKPYLKENVNSYFSLLDENLQPFEGEKMAFKVQSTAGNSFNDICNEMLKVLQSMKTKERVFILVDECYHWFKNEEISKCLSSFKGCWIASVLTGQPAGKVMRVETVGHIFPMRTLRRIYRGTKDITLASSSLRLSSHQNVFFLASKFSYIQSSSNMKIEDIEEITDLCEKENDSFVIIFRGKDGQEKTTDLFCSFFRKNDNNES